MKLVVVRVRGLVDVKKEVQDTLTMLNLPNKNYATILEDTPQNKGMIARVKDYVTFGPITSEMEKELIAKRGEEYKGPEKDSKGKIQYKKFLEVDGKKIKKYFRLHPPQKGYGRAGIKKPFTKGGALGNRKDKINDLLGRMI